MHHTAQAISFMNAKAQLTALAEKHECIGDAAITFAGINEAGDALFRITYSDSNHVKHALVLSKKDANLLILYMHYEGILPDNLYEPIHAITQEPEHFTQARIYFHDEPITRITSFKPRHPIGRSQQYEDYTIQCSARDGSVLMINGTVEYMFEFIRFIQHEKLIHTKTVIPKSILACQCEPA